MNKTTKMRRRALKPCAAVLFVWAAAQAFAAEGTFSVSRFDEPRPEGNWLCTVEFGDSRLATTNWVKAEGRRLMLDRVVTAPGEKVVKKFAVNIRTGALADGRKVKLSGNESKGHERWDDRLTVDVLSTNPAQKPVAAEKAPDDTVTVFLAGDSTVCCYNTEPYGTWGQMLPAFFDETVAVANHAESGRSLQSFHDQLRDAKVLESAKKGDWLFIQFGHNDQKEKCEFEERMRRYRERLCALIDAFEAKGGRVVLVSPMERRRFDANGEPFKTLQEYEDALSSVAKERCLPFINLHDASYRLYTALGEEKSKALFGWRKGEIDNTHHSVYGGYELARAVVEGIREAVPELAARLRPGIPPWTPENCDPDPGIPRTGKTASEKPEEAVSTFGVLPSAWPKPVKEMKPWAYNWWMGSAVDEDGLRRQVDEMKKVGMGGMHVIPIYSVKDNPADKPLLSPEWMKAFGDAVRIAGESGMGVDLTTGSGWCFGGPQLRAEEGCWMLEVNSKKLSKSEVLWSGEDAGGNPVTLSVRRTGQQVKRSGPGAHGPMMNPFSAEAMADFLKPFTEAYDSPGAAKPEHMYHDSYEYFSAGFAWELFDAFKKFRGYDLKEHLAELAGVGRAGDIARVKCDYRETLSDMIVEDVFPIWQKWCEERGIKTRNEAHGAPANWLDFYALADIPETEMFSCDKTKAQWPSVTAAFMNSGDRDVVVSKFASSAAHVKHAGAATDPLVGSESCTWVCEHFCETPAAVKTFVDRLFLSGVNHMFYHGMCYSPADAKWPGWTFYATCEMNRFNPIWRDADVLNRYITRVQSVAQTTAADNDVLVYWPLHDFWSLPEGFERQLTVHARDWLAEQPVGRVARALFDGGVSFDFISERQLARLAASAATRYATIVVPGAVRMKPATFARLAELAGNGGYKVFFVDGMPCDVPGLKDVAGRTAELESLKAAAAGCANIVSGTLEDCLALPSIRREPFCKDAGLMYTRHFRDGVTYYFIANQYRDEGVKGAFKPSAACAAAKLMDPMSGAIVPLQVKDGAVELDLPIGHSAIVAVSGEKPEKEPAPCPYAAESVACVPLDGEWIRRAIVGGPEMPPQAKGTLPLPWGNTDVFPESAFSGTMRYSTHVTLGKERGAFAEIDLGRAAESARVFVNGEEAGCAVMAPWRVRFLSSMLVEGENEIAVETTSTGANRLKWLDATKPYEWQVFTDINMVDINYKKPFDASRWPQHEAGLYGPVRLALYN